MSTTAPEITTRRPLRTRDVRFFRKLAALLARNGVSPNAISASSIVFGCGAGLSFALTSHTEGIQARVLWLLAAVFIQLRLLANMLDGMVAVEGKKGGATGELWNEAPDRVSDVATILGAGYALGSAPVLGWAASASALFVAYVRALGASAGVGQVFIGPMAKPQRMFWLTLVSLFFALTPVPLDSPDGAAAGLLMTLLLIGAVVDFKTIFHRRSKRRLVLTAVCVLVALALRDFLSAQWEFPVMPVALFAITFGGVYTSALRLREIAAGLRRIKAGASSAV